MNLHADLLAILRCPTCRGTVTPRDAAGEGEIQGWLECATCRLRYPVTKGFPVMLAEEAKRMDAGGANG